MLLDALEPDPASVQRVVRGALTSDAGGNLSATVCRRTLAGWLGRTLLLATTGAVILGLVSLFPQRPPGPPDLSGAPARRTVTLMGSGRALVVAPSSQAVRPSHPPMLQAPGERSGSILLIRRRNPS